MTLELSTRRTVLLASRRILLGAAVTLGAIGAAGPGARAADLTEVNFVEAVHNLGYINLYVGQHAGIFEKNGLKLNVSAAGGDTQAFAAVLGGSADFAIGDATMVQMSREAGGPGIVVGTVIQRAHYFGVSKNLDTITDPTQFKGLENFPEVNADPSVIRRAYLKEFAAFQQSLQQACRMQQIDYVLMRTDQPLDVLDGLLREWSTVIGRLDHDLVHAVTAQPSQCLAGIARLRRGRRFERGKTVRHHAHRPAGGRFGIDTEDLVGGEPLVAGAERARPVGLGNRGAGRERVRPSRP